MTQPIDLNLSSRPFRNNTLPWIALVGSCLLLLGFTYWNTSSYREHNRLLSEAREVKTSIAGAAFPASRVSGLTCCPSRVGSFVAAGIRPCASCVAGKGTSAACSRCAMPPLRPQLSTAIASSSSVWIRIAALPSPTGSLPSIS